MTLDELLTRKFLDFGQDHPYEFGELLYKIILTQDEALKKVMEVTGSSTLQYHVARDTRAEVLEMLK